MNDVQNAIFIGKYNEVQLFATISKGCKKTKIPFVTMNHGCKESMLTFDDQDISMQISVNPKKQILFGVPFFNIK